MFSRGCIEKIRWLEAAIYDGPESPEKAYEREEQFDSPHTGSRTIHSGRFASGAMNKKGEIWYTLNYDPDTGELTKEFKK